MTAARMAAILLALTGFLTLVASLGWWWLSYGEVYRSDYLSLREASLCLVGDSEICRLATSLCKGRHGNVVVPYSSGALWLALGFLCAGLMMSGRRPLAAAPKHRS